jgi:hypothetical protein
MGQLSFRLRLLRREREVVRDHIKRQCLNGMYATRATESPGDAGDSGSLSLGVSKSLVNNAHSYMPGRSRSLWRCRCPLRVSSRRPDLPCSTSAQHLKADISVAGAKVRYGPTGDVRNEKGRELGQPPMFGGIEDEAVLSRAPPERDRPALPGTSLLFSS